MVIHVTNMFFTHLLNDKNRKTCLCASLLNVADLNTGFISPLCQYACTLHPKSQLLPTNLRCRQDKEHVTTAPTFSRRYTHTSWSRSLCSRSVGDRFSLKLMMLSYLCANFFWSLLFFCLLCGFSFALLLFLSLLHSPRLSLHHTPDESSCCIALYPSVSVGGKTSNSNPCFQQ